MYIYPHNSRWSSEYVQESKAIISAFGIDIKLHHIGSTAIKGLHAKDCIDILGIVKNLTDIQFRSQNLIDIGYEYKGEYGISDRAYFSKTIRKVHLHVFETNDKNIKKHLNFVKIMTNRPDLVAQLNKLKTELHNKYPNNKDSYQLEKISFYQKINSILKIQQLHNFKPINPASYKSIATINNVNEVKTKFELFSSLKFKPLKCRQHPKYQPHK